MNNVIELIKQRRSVRTYDGIVPGTEVTKQLLSYAENMENPFSIPVTFRLLDAKKEGLSCPVVTGTDLYVGGKVKSGPYSSVAFGYSFETFILYAQSLDLGTVWLGGTMNRSAFERAMELEEDEVMPCATPIGYAAKKMSVRESMMRKAVKADKRLPFEELFFDGSFDTALTEEKAGALADPLTAVRLAPSAVNKQPWRVVIADGMAHFFLKRSKGFGHEGKLDMQMVDMGIALCHFALTAEACEVKLAFVQEAPQLALPDDVTYIASYRVI